MRCLYCDDPIESYSLVSLFLKTDELCPKCRRKLRPKRKKIPLGDLEVETFFDYDGFFRDLLLQYKECHDEALKDVFLYDLKEYLELRYHGYHLLCIPSTGKKLEERGFDHLKEMFRLVQLKKISCLKMKEEITQEGKDLSERRRMETNYAYIGPDVDKILIADDVITTGSTVKGAFSAVKSHAKMVKVISLAYKNITLHL
ncbi:MAG: hypothetical protein K5648_05855 [Erysipelotrichaceae bacterium]|nr:hypothetical protein [Erysipelotrichaceae bacterium]